MTDDALFPSSLPVMTTVRGTASGREWLGELPSLVDELSSRWELRLAAPYHGGSCSWVAAAQRRDGSRAVLKVTWPHREARPEGEVLRLWAGRGSVLVHEHDEQRYALLLERCDPGTELGSAGHIPAEERLVLGAEVLRELWASGQGAPAADSRIERLSDVAGEWADLADERAGRHEWPAEVDTGLFTLGARLLRELPFSAGHEAVLHGDFNPGNLLAAERRPWLAIDAKPMYGDPAFDPWRLIEQIDDPFAHPEPHRVLRRRTALVADALGEDAARLHAWALARHVDYVLWSVDGGGLSDSVELMRRARILADVAGL